MSATRKAVQVIWHDAEGTQKITLDFIACSTCDAVCMMLDNMEAAGIDMDAIDILTIVSKSGIGADLLMAADDAEFRANQARRAQRNAMQEHACAA